MRDRPPIFCAPLRLVAVENEHPRSSRASLSDLGARLPSNADEDEDAANLQTVPLR
ncbi:hypothetical protein HBI56_185960 [Parastagonospora nodorum]|uniref:Uncharacterized protein n=1 Tax=Phaeosphaeria nodorum (strain SN15 / ATCC MYA-4574 / FGSC 10173) TaxID=321614 RepID=A0A7U2NQB1_PHANO|nr:hypothetical protein HBH56_163610 [Parastagonospora nodorum]QRD06509.1 hypothetical protein JI435_118770 [Parastagonospora nodorum SN15]KAH3932124.1 hypothetical protein HBH54_085620 [Parastagonospora nodorum]KAH3947476.1 hypothetical protein HBH53_112890 [Parastagonospora nodorum]KAH3968896.1 hypothetical protein HBH52_176990 [Parastagonospora nodorum]